MSKERFSVTTDNPFQIVQTLQRIAPADAIDLSRGDPGLGFSPGRRGRELAAAVIALDAAFNDERRDVPKTLADLDAPLEHIFSGETLAAYRTLLQEFTKSVIRAAKEQGREWQEGDILQGLFRLSALTGGSYLNPLGEEITRTVVAGLHRLETGLPVTASDVLLTAGASQAMAIVFKLFASTGYLTRGDAIAMTTPSYWPNRGFAQELRLSVLGIDIDIHSGTISPESLRRVGKAQSPPKVIFLIDPHNPTGFKLTREDLESIAAIARAQDAIIVSEELYFPFLPGTSITSLCPERTMRVHARSKSERATGLRFGEIVMTNEARETLRRKLRLHDEAELWQAFRNTKAPGFGAGQFQHTTFVPGPSQLLGIAHLVLGNDDRQRFVDTVRSNHRSFVDILGLPHRNGTYYLVFDMQDVLEGGEEASPRGGEAKPLLQRSNLSARRPAEVRPRSRGLASGQTAEELLITLAKSGVIYLPAVKFFEEGTAPPTLVRASVANAGRGDIIKAAEITRQVLGA